ncbi:MAG: lipoate--protein ligase family protein [Euryarchaeota archaeon]|nr:lipoate--protein ligase family protein [Euryarchaeota archaeon]
MKTRSAGRRSNRRTRIVDTGEAHPHLTGAIDELLLRLAGGGAGDALHLYSREPPAVTYGYFEKAAGAVDLAYCRNEGIVPMRRLSGGSAIYTDRNQIVYAIATRDGLSGSPDAVYETVCGGIAQALESLGVDASYKKPNDVQYGGRKLSGSAMTRKYGGVLVHGTIIIDLDRVRMERALRLPDKHRERGAASHGGRVTSLAEVLGKAPPTDNVKRALVAGLCERMRAKPFYKPLSADEKVKALELVRTRYGTDKWNLRR